MKNFLFHWRFVVIALAIACPAEAQEKKASKLIFPIIEGYGGVVALPDAVEQPRKGTKVVFDVTAVAKEAGKPLPGLERAAVLLNLGGASGLTAADMEMVIVLHGEATAAALDDQAFKTLHGRINENAELLGRLTKAGVKIMVCGQTLERKSLDRKSIRSEIAIAASAVSATVNHQSRGYAFIPSH